MTSPNLSSRRMPGSGIENNAAMQLACWGAPTFARVTVNG